MNGKEWLGKRVRVFAGHDHRKEHGPMAEGEVIAYIDGPSIVVRGADGQQATWPVSLPIDSWDPPKVTNETAHQAVVAYIRKRAEDYRTSSPQTSSNMFSLAREIEGDPGVTPRLPAHCPTCARPAAAARRKNTEASA